MDMVSILKVVGMFATVVFLFFLVKELVKTIKESRDGRVSDRCDLD